MKTFSPTQLRDYQAHLSSKKILVDVRTPEEFAIEHIEGAINMPVDRFEDFKEKLAGYDQIVAYCNSGNSSAQFIKRATHAGIDTVRHLAGGMSGCKGQCTIVKHKATLPMMQQVQIAAGSLVLIGLVGAWLIDPVFIGISIFVGAGLIFAGSTGWCGMAKILAMMPWNRIGQPMHTTVVEGKDLHIKQFEDTYLAHYSYMVISDGQAIVVDPERDPHKYYTYAQQHHATIVGVFNTHPHADFASGHLQIHQDTQAPIYVSEKVGADYPHVPLKDRQHIMVGRAQIVAYETPGHSPDSMSYLVVDAAGNQRALFTGDWVFIGDVGRADLRENVGNIQAKQEELATQMYQSTRTLLPTLDPSLWLLPAHGAGTSCGKGLSKQSMDTLANQLKYNPMLQEMSQEDFVRALTSDQPTIPAYFTHSVLLNKQGNTSYAEAKRSLVFTDMIPDEGEEIIIDMRAADRFLMYPLVTGAISIPHDAKAFVGMLGAVLKPTQRAHIIVEKHADLEVVIHGILSIGYEDRIASIFIVEDHMLAQHMISQEEYTSSPEQYTIVDVRSSSSYQDNPFSPDAINIPLEQLMDKRTILDSNKTYIPYCGGQYKSRIAYSLLVSAGMRARILGK